MGRFLSTSFTQADKYLISSNCEEPLPPVSLTKVPVKVLSSSSKRRLLHFVFFFPTQLSTNIFFPTDAPKEEGIKEVAV